ncbi:hypothetical protein PV726_41380 [Streptomyces europaeiscabiei]|uniref:hypothetical protein n=1 Tax=Streptomyces europaeiscabiei TaxID=146819 RepID=UPI0029B7E0B1|nr:hypothetical protein [Streptomyces europaeiscabiei]MDX3696605.1 hypothetical protein [Streptomyces europaeiscabiei]
MTELTGPEEHQLRLALGMIGEAAGGDEPTTPPGRRPSRQKRPSTIVVALVAAAALSLGLLTFELTNGGNADGTQQEQAQALTHTEWIACSPMIVEGDVVAVRDHPQQADAVNMTLTVTDWIKPGQGTERRIEFTTMSAKWKGEPPYAKGEHLLVVVMDRPDEPADTFRANGAGTSRTLKSVRSRIKKDLPAAAKTECPAFWRNRDDDNGGRGDG